MDIEQLKRLVLDDTVWINTVRTGVAVADNLEAEGIKVNRFTPLDQSKIQQLLSYDTHIRPNKKVDG